MTVPYSVTSEILQKFKVPFGRLVEGTYSEAMSQLKKIIEEDKPSEIVSVGDTVTMNMHHSKIVPRVAITDNRSMRRKTKPQSYPEKETVQVKNPPGTITQEAVEVITEAFQKKNSVHIVVQGEEDLLTLVAVLYAPQNALVIYGQPRRGIVVVKVTPRKKAEAQKIWNSMKPHSNHGKLR